MTEVNEESGPLNSRSLTRTIAFRLAMNGEIPTAEKVRRLIVEETQSSLKPSALTIQSEMKKWYDDTFWPTFRALASMPDAEHASKDLQLIFGEALQRILVHVFGHSEKRWRAEREELQQLLSEAQRSADSFRSAAERHETLAAENDGLYRDELAAHAATKARVEGLQVQIQNLTARLEEAHQIQAEHERELNRTRETERARADTEIEAARQERHRVLREIDSANQIVKRLEVVNNELAGETKQIREKLSKTEAELAAAIAEANALRGLHAVEISRMTEALNRAAHGADSEKSHVSFRERVTRSGRHNVRKTKLR